MNHYLLFYDAKNDVSRYEEFGTDIDAALDAYEAAEKEYADRPEMNVVLVGSADIESVKVTHSTYFARGGSTFIERVQNHLSLENFEKLGSI